MLICENCEKGYADTNVNCIWCGADSTFAHSSNQHSILDTECYVDYWCCRFSTGEIFQQFGFELLDRGGLVKALSKYTVVTFNGNAYDMLMLEKALEGASCEELKRHSDTIIQSSRYGRPMFHNLKWIDHIDIFNVLPGKLSLKEYGAKNHTKKLQDLPYEPSSRTTWEKRWKILTYCGNDCDVTAELFDKYSQQIQLRINIGDEYGVDVRSKSDPQIAEAVVKKILNRRIDIPAPKVCHEFVYKPPSYLFFYSLDLHVRILQYPFVINEAGRASPHHDADFIEWSDNQVRWDPLICNFVNKPKGYQSQPIFIGGKAYTFGIGGLHSTEKSTCHIAQSDELIIDFDVASYYPKLIVNLGIYPEQIGRAFIEFYTKTYYERLKAKAEKNTKKANSLKTLLNGIFGKLGSKYSIFYAPEELINVTLSGQLSVMMLIDWFAHYKIDVVSANTDGVTVKCKKSQESLVELLVKQWCERTNLEMERVDYRLIAARDVNNYFAIKSDGSLKVKGAYAEPEPGASNWPSPSGQICSDAVAKYLMQGVPVDRTVYDERDIRKFIFTAKVSEGACYVDKKLFPKNPTKKFEREVLASNPSYTDYSQILLDQESNKQYLGKVVRWYHARDYEGCLCKKTSNALVPGTTGCKALMTLPDDLPDDLDFNWYVQSAYEILNDIGVKLCN